MTIDAMNRPNTFYDNRRWRWRGDYQDVQIEETADIPLYGDSLGRLDAFRKSHCDCELEAGERHEASYLEITGWRDATPEEVASLPGRITAKAQAERAAKEQQIARLREELYRLS